MTSIMITLQELICRLTQFWKEKGCVIHQGHDLETGAGTFNPATFLRCLGPEPYQAAYVEPSRRPSDGRFGQNPNRLQLFHQFQVILKPSPLEVQALYLESLECIGFNLKEHDIRFVHDDWESPTLGAWGLGWEVWCDGMEVSQFTYFQGMASLPLKPVTAEITYGLERLSMFIQNVDNIFDLKWNETLTLGDISKQNEIEWSQYNFSEASIPMWLRHFEDYENEAKRLIWQKLPLPAYDFVIKASHAFNLLDARGVISVTERTGYIGRIRELSRLVATAYIESRETLQFPLIKEVENPKEIATISSPTHSFTPGETRDFLFEIGSEQLPASFIPLGMKSLEKLMRSLLEKENLQFERLECYGAPRRLALLIQGLSTGTKNLTLEKKGPPLSIVFDQQGELSLQGQKFLSQLGLPAITLDELQKNTSNSVWIQEIKQVPYLFAKEEILGKSTLSILKEALPHIVGGIEFPKRMRWGYLETTYARPLHWITALFGDEVIPFQYGDINSSRVTYGHAQRGNEKLFITRPLDYLPLLRDHFVLADVNERKTHILNQIHTLEKTHGIQFKDVNKVLSQVVHLTEWPELILASFDARFLTLPQEVITSEMIEHQKYFPVSKDGVITNQFVITCDNTPSSLISRGNQKVLSARLSDGAFLYEQDLKTPLPVMNEKLETVVFQKDLGSVGDKVSRIHKIATYLQRLTHLSSLPLVEKAASLCKADLASSLVKEFPELQGTLGEYYALYHGEERECAQAMREHWLPRFEGDALPLSPTGTLLCLADKCDNLLGYYSVGLKPTSSSDPYALRRQTIGIIRLLIQKELSLDLCEVLKSVSPLYPHFKEPLLLEILAFITARSKLVFEEMGFKKDEIEASLSQGCCNPYVSYSQLKALKTFRQTAVFKDLLEVYKRAKGVLETPVHTSFNKELTLHPSEQELFALVKTISLEWDDLLKTHQYEKIYALLATLQPPLSRLFQEVKILDPDPIIRNNRLALLTQVFAYFSEIVNLSLLQGP
ncbi:MAG: glycine--tRNA ligase subunit beta [Candidatus Rhabdochlamydia sp.]